MSEADERHVLRVLGDVMDVALRLIIADTRFGLRPSQFRVIASVPIDGAITVTELAERVGMTKQGIGQFVTQLTRDGYLATQADPADRRVRLVRRTDLASEAMHALAGSLRALEDEWAAHVGSRRYRTFRAVLDEIAAL